MEPQEKVCCYDNTRHGCEYKEENKKNCLGIIATILLAAFTTVIGIILGASLAGTFLASLAAIIVLARNLQSKFLCIIIFSILGSSENFPRIEKRTL